MLVNRERFSSLKLLRVAFKYSHKPYRTTLPCFSDIIDFLLNIFKATLNNATHGWWIDNSCVFMLFFVAITDSFFMFNSMPQ